MPMRLVRARGCARGGVQWIINGEKIWSSSAKYVDAVRRV